MTRGTKGYRRFRARGRPQGDDGGLEALRALNARREAAGNGAGDLAASERAAERAAERARRDERRRRRSEARQRRHWWSLRDLTLAGWIGRLALLVLGLLVVWAGLGYWALDRAVGESNSKLGPGVRAVLDQPGGGMLGTPTNTLIIGSDARRGETRSRADTILVMRTDPDAGRIKYLSIPRDFRVDLPGLGTQKINAAFRFGGQRGMIRAVKDLTGLPVHHVIVIKFSGFERLVEELGGVTVDNPTALVDCPYEAGQTVSFPKGDVRLDGERALAYVRVRKCDSDLERARRQQALVVGLKDRVLSLGNVWRAPWSGADVVRTLHTDMGTIDVMKFGWLQARLEQGPDDRILLSGSPQLIGGESFIIGDPDANEREIARFVAT